MCDLTITRAGRGPLLGRHRRRGRAPRPRVDAPQPARRRLGRPHRPAPRRCAASASGARWRATSWASRSEDDLSNEALAVHARAGRCTSATSPCRALRVSYVGELGWEIYAPAEFGRAAVGHAVGGRAAAGRGRLRRRRLRLAAPGEGLPAVGPGHRRGARPLRGRPGLGRAAGQGRGLHRPRRRGRGDQGARRRRGRLCCLVTDDPAVMLVGKEPLLDGDAPGRLRDERRLRRDAGREHPLRLPAGRARRARHARSPCTAPAPTTA